VSSAAARRRRLLTLLIAAAVGGLVLGWLTAGIFWGIGELVDLVWTDLPSGLGVDTRWYPLVVCTLGGLLIGLGQKYLGDHPPELNELLSHDDKTQGFDLRILPQALYLLVISLTFGGALGPELTLVFVGGTLALAVTRRLRTAEATATARDVVVAALFGAMFVSPLGGAATAVEDPARRPVPRAERLAVAIVAGLAGVVAFAMVPTPGLTVVANWPAYQAPHNGTDALWGVALGLAGAGLGVVYTWLHAALERLRARIPGVVIPALLGGVVLGLAGSWTTLVLFSGQEGIESLADALQSRSTAELAGLAAGKLLLVPLLLALGWKGGHFYPMLFVASATGLFFASIVGALEPLVAVAAVSAGLLAVVLRRPVAAALLVLLVVPASLLAVSAAAAATAFVAVRVVEHVAAPGE
jgi:chloride channel protein, CIC family